MPPTPIPSHAHPHYYQQSPQRTPVSYHLVPVGQPMMTDGNFAAVQHAMPYPMMMHPPGPPHPYDPNAQPPPPVPMGGVSHA